MEKEKERQSYQVFDNEEEIKQYVISIDPLKEFVATKREINWDPDERNCYECGEIFKPTFPAEVFCIKCKDKEDKKNKRASVSERMKKNPTIEVCNSCGNEFYKTAPAMRNCIKCSEKGGKLVREDSAIVEETTTTNN